MMWDQVRREEWISESGFSFSLVVVLVINVTAWLGAKCHHGQIDWDKFCLHSAEWIQDAPYCPTYWALKIKTFAGVEHSSLYVLNKCCPKQHCWASEKKNNEKYSNSLVLLAINGVKELLEFLSGEDPVGKVSVELFKRQLAVIWNTVKAKSCSWCHSMLLVHRPGPATRNC